MVNYEEGVGRESKEDVVESKDTFHMDDKSPHPKVSFSNGYFENYEEYEAQRTRDTNPDKQANELDADPNGDDSIFVNSNAYEYVYDSDPKDDPTIFEIAMPNMKLCVAALICGILGLGVIAFVPGLGLALAVAAFLCGTFGKGDATVRPTVAKVGITIAFVTFVLSPYMFAMHM